MIKTQQKEIRIKIVGFFFSKENNEGTLPKQPHLT